MTKLSLYWKRSPHEVDWFEELMRAFPRIKFFQPAPEQAPWHVQAKLPNGVLINFWPHAYKAMIQDEPPVVIGSKNIEMLLFEALARPPDEIELIE